MRKINYPDLLSEKRQTTILPPRIDALDFCRIWFGIDQLSYADLYSIETWGIKKVYSNLLGSVLDVSPASIARWSVGKGVQFNEMPPIYKGYLSCILAARNQNTAIQDISERIRILRTVENSLIEERERLINSLPNIAA